jgi:hypothetical protein
MKTCRLARPRSKPGLTPPVSDDATFAGVVPGNNATGKTTTGAKSGAPKAITAIAHNLARILWHLLKHQEPFNPEVFAMEEQKMKRRQLARLQNLARSLNCSLVPNQ